ncbi:MAG: AAA family ATPase [Thermoleophilaceae bacterium]
MLRVRVLGELALDLDGRVLEPPASRRARSLLGLLAVDRRAHQRSQLAARFWPDVLDESARTSLRSALSSLRRSLGPDADRYLLAGRDSVALAGPDDVATDLAEFETLLADGRAEEALELCRGDLLDGLDDDWVFAARDDHRDRVADALATLAAGAEESGDMDAAVTFSRRRVVLDPLAEEAQRELIRRLAAAGDRPAAITAYRRLQDRLRSELGIAPSARTRELAESLREEAGEPVAAHAPVAPAEAQAPAAPAPPATASPRPSGTVTLLFTDQVSSTETLQRLGDDEAERLRRTHFGLLREVAGAHGGQEVKNLGDGLMVAFTSAVDAVAAAIGIQQAVHRHAERAGDDRLGVRVGLNVGEPIVDEDDYFGTPVVVAKRLCDAAASGQILASDVVRALVGTRGGFEFRSVGAMPLKGIADSVPACEVGWAPTTEQRIPLPPAVETADAGELVGRSGALAELERHWLDARAGSPRVVALAGDPGIGKTRLAAELCRRAHADGAAVLAGRCYEETLVPYQPFVEALRHYVAGAPPAELTVQLAPRRRELAALVPDLADGREPAPRASADAEQERFRLLEAAASLILEAAAARPLILLLDDLHWADDATLLLLRHLARSFQSREGAELMVVVTFRDTELAARGELVAALAELRRARVLHELQLGGLAGDAVAELIAAQSGAAAEESFARRVAERTDGNPFFIEELLRHVPDARAAELDELGLPESVKDLLLRRLERLGEDSRGALAIAAVAGAEFDLAVVARVLGEPDDSLLDPFDAALAAHVLAEDPATVGRYRFAHPLIRETIYGDLSATRRALVHRRIGEALEELHPDALAEHAGALARHFHAGGDAAKAYDYHRQAAAAAARVYALETALAHLDGAIAAAGLLNVRPEDDAGLRRLFAERGWTRRFVSGNAVADSVHDYEVALAAARAAGDRELEMEVLNALGTLSHIADSERAIRHHGESLALAEELGDEAGQVAALNRLSLVHANQLDLVRAQELGERALELARGSGDEVAVARALDGLKFVALMLGDTERLEDVTSQLATVQRRREDIWFLLWTLSESAFTPIVQADFAEADRRVGEALALARRMGDTMAETLILAIACSLERSRGRYSEALRVGERAVALTHDATADVWLGWTGAAHARCLADLGLWEEACSLLEDGLSAADRINARGQAFGCVGDLAWARLQTGDVAGARAAAERWDDAAAQVHAPSGQACLYFRTSYTGRARVALALGDRERAESILRALLVPVERSGVRDAAADAHAALAACALDRGDSAEAQRLLARGLELLGPDGFPAERLRLVLALAALEPGGEHETAADALVEAIATSTESPELAAAFRARARLSPG